MYPPPVLQLLSARDEDRCAQPRAMPSAADACGSEDSSTVESVAASRRTESSAAIESGV